MRSKDIEDLKKSLKLSLNQRSILIGTLLGDGHLETQNKGRTYRLKIEHSIRQAFYVDWIYEQFIDWTRTGPKSKVKLLGKVRVENYSFQTLSVGQFRFYAKSFYRNGVKRVPSQIDKWLTPLALAVWFMDDGSAKSKLHRAIILNTQGFKRVDIDILIKALKSKFGIEAQIRKQSDGLQILIVGKNAEQFFIIVRRYVFPNFDYKFGALVNKLPKKYRRRSKVS